MEWNTILLKTTIKKNSPSHVIKGICTINDKIYLLDYVLFSQFEWWMAFELESIESYNPNVSYEQEANLFYNSADQQFYTKENLPDHIRSLLNLQIMIP